MLDFQMILKLICFVCQRVWHLMLFHPILKLMSVLVKEFLHLSCSSSRTQTHVLFVKEVCIFCSQLQNCLWKSLHLMLFQLILKLVYCLLKSLHLMCSERNCLWKSLHLVPFQLMLKLMSCFSKSLHLMCFQLLLKLMSCLWTCLHLNTLPADSQPHVSFAKEFSSSVFRCKLCCLVYP